MLPVFHSVLSFMQFALTYASGVFDTRTKLMGRQSAGVGFLKAVLAAEPERLWCYAESRALAQEFGRDVLALVEKPPEVRFIPWDEPARLAQAGVLYRADPNIGEDAWHRRNRSSARAYSLCGITHTMSSHGAMGVVKDYLTSPVFPWDAVICTSTVARDLVRTIIETEMEHLRMRLGATAFTLPQLPLIPLGTHVDDFAFTADQRSAARARLGLGGDEVAVLFAGRLSFHGKAHPLPMFVGLERAARRTGRKVHLILFGTFPSPSNETVWRAEAGKFAPSVVFHHLDGSSNENRDAVWAGADIFTSLSDNIQETFGLTPLEGMAAGLPVVVSDWNGYKDTVRDGIDGFRVPTVAPPPGCGIDLADRFAHRLLDYDRYIGAASLFAAVDVDAAAEAYTKLIGSADLRCRMGEAGQRRARETFDWPVIFRRYMGLWDDLAERRRADPAVAGEGARTPRSDRLDPFTLFATHSTARLSVESRVRLREGATAAEAQSRLKLGTVSYAATVLPSEASVARIVEQLATMAEGTSLGELATALKLSRPERLFRTVAWLAKMDILEVMVPKPA